MKKDQEEEIKTDKLKNILNSYWKKKNVDESNLIPRVKKKMKKASISYKSFMEMHNILKKTYKTIINKKK